MSIQEFQGQLNSRRDDDVLLQALDSLTRLEDPMAVLKRQAADDDEAIGTWDPWPTSVKN
jgi:hypothetical protein